MRDQVRRRPLVAPFLGLWLGLVARDSWALVLLILPLLWLAGSAASRLLLSLAWVVGILYGSHAASERPKGTWTGAAMVASWPASDHRIWIVEKGGLRQLIVTPRGFELGLFDRIAIQGEATGRGLPRAEAVEKLGGLPWAGGFAKARERAREMTQSLGSEDRGKAASALLLATSSELPDDTRSASLQRFFTGASLHVFVIALLAGFFAERLPVPGFVQWLILFALLIGFVLFLGITPAVLRASLLALILRLARWIRREPDVLSALSLVNLLELIWIPSEARSSGFALTTGAIALTWAFVAAGPHFRPVRAIRGGFLMAPLLCACGAPVSLVGVLVSPIAGLFSILASGGLWIGFLVSAISPLVGGFVARIFAAPWLDGLLFLSRWEAESTWARAPAGLNPWWLIPIYGAIALLWRERRG